MALTRPLSALMFALLVQNGAFAAEPEANAAADAEHNLIKNGSFEHLPRRGLPEPWVAAQHAGPAAYRFTVDAEHAHSGKHSLRIHRFQPQVYGMAEQIIPADQLAGKTLRFTIWARSADVGPEGATAFLGAYESSLMLQESRGAAITGNTDWTRFEMTIEVPPAATHIQAGIILHDAGTVWIDSAELVLVEAAAAPAATAQ